MASPILGVLASPIAQIIKGGAQASSGLLSFLPGLGSLTTNIAQFDWQRHPILPPTTDALINAMMRGYFEDKNDPEQNAKLHAAYVKMMRIQGFALGDEGYGDESLKDYAPYKLAWKQVIDSVVVRPGLMEGITAYNAGLITNTELSKMAQQSGAMIEDWSWLIPLMGRRLDIVDLMELYKRGTLTEQQFDQYLKFLQFTIPDDRKRLKELTNVIPGYGDVIRFAIREAFNPNMVRELGLDKELDQNPEYLAVAKAAGLGPITLRNSNGELQEFDFAKMYWYAHWDLPSPTMAYQMNYRLYGDSRYGASPYLKYAPKFERKDLQNLLKANDYSPQFRPHLEAISYLPFTRIDVRRIRKAGLITRAEVYHNYRASGYDDFNANALTEWLERDIADGKTTKFKNAVKNRACKAYQLGLLNEANYKTTLKLAKFDDDEITVEHSLCDMDSANNIAKDGIGSIKNGFLSGAYTEQEARQHLTTLGISVDRTNDYMFLWGLKLSSRRRVVAAKEVSQWFIDGIINMNEFISRLTKLDYSQEDITRMTQAAVLEQGNKIKKANKVAAKEAEREIQRLLREAQRSKERYERMERERRKELQRQQHEADRRNQERLSRFLSARTEANLRKWLSENQISESEVRETFRLKGWSEQDIERWLNVERNNR